MKMPDFQTTQILFSVPGRKKCILQVAAFGLNFGQCLFIIGENGAGKTSLLSVLGGYVRPDVGDVFLVGKKLKPLSERLVPGFEEVEFVGQQHRHDQFLTVEENLKKGVRIFGNVQRDNLLHYWAKWARIYHLLGQKAGNLSGGEARRLALAIAMARRPKVLLLDEPFAELDIISRLQLLQMLMELKAQHAVALIIVSHHPKEAFWLAEEIRIIKGGKWLERIKPVSGAFLPKRVTSARLLGLSNIISQKKLGLGDLNDKSRFWQIPPSKFSFFRDEGLFDLGRGKVISVYRDQNQWMHLMDWKDEILLVSSPIPAEEGKFTHLFAAPDGWLGLR